MLKKHLRNKVARKELLDLAKQAVIVEETQIKYKKILFCPLNGTTVNTYRESILALGCEARGANVEMLYLDSIFESSEFYKSTSERLIYKFKVNKNISYCKKLGIPTVKSSNFNIEKRDKLQLTESNINEFNYNGILLGDLVLASSVRAHLCNSAEWHNPAFVDTINKVGASAIKLAQLYDKILSQHQPDKLVMSHGMYVSWGVLFRLARKRGIDVVVYSSSYRKNSIRFYHNAPAAPFPLADWGLYKDVPLNALENKLLDEYIKGREKQKDDNISLFDDRTVVPDHLKEFIEENKGKKIFCLFTNIAWDAFAFSKGNSFGDMIEWLDETIDFFKTRKDAALIVKAHPAEEHFKTPVEYRVKSFIATKKLSANIKFIKEDEEVKPFWLYDKIDFGLIHISTVAIEMALQGIPVLTSGANGHYSHNGFTVDPESKKDYFNHIENLIKQENYFVPDIKKAREYMFFRFFREAIEFDVIKLKNLSTIEGLNIKNRKELLKGNNKTLDLICEGILNNGKFITEYE